MIASIKGKSSRKASGNINRLLKTLSHVYLYSLSSVKNLYEQGVEELF